MIQGFELFVALFHHLTLFITLICLYGLLLTWFKDYSWLQQPFFFGAVFGLSATGCLWTRALVPGGMAVDLSPAVVFLSAVFGGPASALVTATLAGTGLVLLGQPGVLGGGISICLAAGGGILLRKIPGPFSSVTRAAASAVLATLIILPWLAISDDFHLRWLLFKAVALPYGLAVFTGIFLAGLLIQRERTNHTVKLTFQKGAEQLDLALSGANEGLWDWNLETDEVHFDARYYTLAGYAPGEFPPALGEWEKRIHPEDLPAVRARVRHYLDGRLDEYHAEFRFLNKSGAYQWIQGKGKIVSQTRTGRPRRFIGTHADITRRKEIEQSLRITRFSFDAAAIGIYLVAPDARILDVNHHAATMLGYATEELKGKFVFDIDPEASAGDTWDRVWQALCKEGKSQLERIHRHKDGYGVPVEITASLFEYDNQQFSLSFVKDITRRRETEKQVRGLRNYLASVIESMPSVLIGVDAHCRATLWNKRAEGYMSGTVRSAGTLPADEMFPLLRPHMHRIADSVKTRQIRQILKHGLARENGEKGYADIVIYPLWADGIDGAVIRIDDVTDKVRMENVLIQNEKMLSIGGLAAGMAHEINNPLAGVIQNAGVMANRLTNRAIPANVQTARDLGTSMDIIAEYMDRRSIPQMLHSINDACTRMASIVDNMLSFARKGSAAVSSHDIAVLVDKVLELAATGYDLKKHYDFKAIALEKCYGPDLPLVACHGGEIQQVILNLLSNGAHAMFEKRGKAPARFIIRLAHETDSNMLRMEIEDNGPGMDRETCAKIFEPFFTTKPVGVGTGLGLSVSYFIITENHKGTMAVLSEPGKGSCFIIRIPVKRAF